MIDQTIIAIVFIAIVLLVIGINMIMSSAYTMPPVPAGWVVGLVMTNVGASVGLSGTIVVGIFQKRRELWTVATLLGLYVVGMGIRNLVIYPLELPVCPCPSNTYSKACLPCPACDPVHSEGCNEGSEGNGECVCKIGWAGPTCSVCDTTFTGINCDECKRGWEGLECDRCSPPYTGKNCDQCKEGWITEGDIYGTLCRRCKPNRYGAYCEVCPNCQEHDASAVCKDNDYHEMNTYDPSKCTLTANTCTDNYDCASFNCKGQCTIGSITDGTFCETSTDCLPGWECEYKSCCLEDRYGDGTCQCNQNGYMGDLCEPCPGFDGIYSSSICNGHGFCAAVYVGTGSEATYSHLKCECTPEGPEPFPAWTGETCGCLKNHPDDTSCSKCANGAFGPQCDQCPGGGGVSQCNGNGVCSDGKDGDGTCECYVDISFNGLGGWGGNSCDACHSDDFYGNKCEACPNSMLVGCHTSTNLAPFPGVDGTCISSCGEKVCNVDTGICQ